MTNPQRRDPAKILPEITWDAIAPPYPDYHYFDGVERYPFRHRATAFDMVNAWWLIEASTLAHAEKDFVRPRFQKAGLTEVKIFTGKSTQYFVANNNDFAIIVFRGTEIHRHEGEPDFRNIIADIKADADIMLTESGQRGKVHRGFKDALDEVWVKKGLFEYIKIKIPRTEPFGSQDTALAPPLPLSPPRDMAMPGACIRSAHPGLGMSFSRMISTSAHTGLSITTISLREYRPLYYISTLVI